MKYGTKEFEDAVNMFEKTARSIDGGFYLPSIEKCDKVFSIESAKSGDIQIYNNGETNKMFQVFLSGTSYGKII